ncbi:MAG TPA: glycosyltransferase family 39 protein [Acetobacteraceae bacterium]|nr:glycosyltransferase family 39 protein [Acetobacteraceae bacterium]
MAVTSPATATPDAGVLAAIRPKRAIAALLVLTLARLVVAATAPLSPDEAYYRIWAHALAPGYLDHPPMVALWIRAGTWFAGETALGVRLFGPLSAALGSVLLARAAEDFFPGRRAGFVAAALLNATLLLGVGSVIMTPDTPLILFWTAALWCLGRLLRTGDPRWWLATGLAAGLALDSKYTGFLLGLGLAVWILAVPEGRRWLRAWQLWAGGALAAAVFTPVILWNAGHGWASFVKQGGRTGVWHPADALRFLSELVGGQIGLATPLVLALCVLGVARAARLGWRGRAPGPALLACLTLVPAAVFLLHALGDRVQANWPCVLYPAGCLAAAGLAARGWRPAVALGLVLVIPAWVQASAAPFALPRRLDPTLIRLGGWDRMTRQVEAVAAWKGADYVVADEYGLASVLAWNGRRLPVAGVEARWALFDLPPAALAGHTGLLVRSTRRAEPPNPALWATARLVGEADRSRGGVVAEQYRLYLVTARPETGPAVQLDHATR